MSRRRMLLGTGWKMNKTVGEATHYMCRLLELLSVIRGVEQAQIFVLPPFTAIEAVKRTSAGRIWVGAQNMHWAEWGAYTGEISAPMLCELGVELVELGHAERRAYFNETDKTVNRKVHMALRYGLRPLVCIGERLADKEYGAEKEAVARQLKAALRGIAAEYAARLIVAYEPAWAIGEEGTTAPPEYIRVMHTHIRGTLVEIFGAEVAALVPVIYGGSVTSDNAAALVVEGHTDGIFVGRAAWQAEGFANLIRACLEAAQGRCGERT
jgi:triosephosphate isomerase